MKTTSESFALSKDWKILFSSEGPHSHFFGYYCQHPLSTDGRFLLAHRTQYDARELVEGDSAEVGYFSLPGGLWTKLGDTKAFNWQDGSMLQWIPASGNEIVYNILGDDGNPAAIRTDLKNTKRVPLEKPVYALHPSGNWALGVNVSRIAECRPSYGYRDKGMESGRWKGFLPEGDGLFHIDLSSGKSSLLLETAKLAEETSCEFPADARHFIQNPIWNPSGTRFVALHRYTMGSSFRSRLFSADSEGQNIHFFQDASLYSHAAWKNDKEFVIWSNPGTSFSSRYLTQQNLKSRPLVFLRFLLKPVRQMIRGNSRSMQRALGFGYYLFEDQSNQKTPVGRGLLSIDGHPGFARGGGILITDTYQDKKSFRRLIDFDMETGKSETIGKFFSPFNNCGFRCDLHPRVSADGKTISVDSAHTGRRQIYVLQRR